MADQGPTVIKYTKKQLREMAAAEGMRRMLVEVNLTTLLRDKPFCTVVRLWKRANGLEETEEYTSSS